MRRSKLLLTVMALGLSSCATQPQVAAELQRPSSAPSADWPLAAPAEAGLSSEKLSELTQALRSDEIPNVHAVLIEHDGRLIYEEYFTGTDQRWGEWRNKEVTFDRSSLHDLRSVTKSVTSLLLGIALKDNYRSKLNRPLVSYFPNRAGTFGKGVEQISLEDALTMRAGLQWEELEVPYTNPENDEIRMTNTADPVGMVLARPVVETPGEKWNYNGGLTQVLAGVIHRETGRPIDAFADQVLFEPLGIEHHEWLGPSIWGSDQSPSAASGLRLRPRDLAKIGSLVLNEGKWRERQIVPAEWIDLLVERRDATIPFLPHYFGYGGMWYPGTVAGHRVIAAFGNGEQSIFVLPDRRLAITTLAGNYGDWNPERPLGVLNRVIAAMEEESRLSVN